MQQCARPAFSVAPRTTADHALFRVAGVALLSVLGFLAGCATTNAPPSSAGGANFSAGFADTGLKVFADTVSQRACARFLETVHGSAFRALACPDATEVLVISGAAASFVHPPGGEQATSLLEFREDHCSATSQTQVHSMGNITVSDGVLKKTTFSGEPGWIRFRAPRIVNSIAFSYLREGRGGWEAVRYDLLVFSVFDAEGNLRSRLNVGHDAWGVGYIEVWAGTAATGVGIVPRRGPVQGEHLVFRFDLPSLTDGDHVLVFGQRASMEGQGSNDTFAALDGSMLFASRVFFIPDLFAGAVGMIELPGDAAALTILGYLGGEPVCIGREHSDDPR